MIGDEMSSWVPFGHNCQRHIPKNAKVNELFTCVCGITYKCSRRWPWRKWVVFAESNK